MQSIIFDFTIVLQSENAPVLIADSHFVVISAYFDVVRIADMKDYALSSQVRGRASSGNVQYQGIVEYCGEDKFCLRQTLYAGVFADINMVNFDIESGDGYQPKYLLLDTTLPWLMHIHNYTFYDLVHNASKFLLRPSRMIAISGAIPQKVFLPLLSVPLMEPYTENVYSILYSAVSGGTGFALPEPRYAISDARILRIINNESQGSQSLYLYSEKKDQLSDGYFEMEFHLSTLSEDVGGLLFSLGKIEYRRTLIDLSGFVSDFDIILSSITALGFFGPEINFIYTGDA